MSLNQESQIVEEEYIIDLFRKHYSGFPKGKLLKTESPDFILKETPKTAIGIELTKLHGPDFQPQQIHSAGSLNGYQPPEFNKENIDFTIRSKGEKLYLYRQKKLNQIWLLITADLNESPVAYNLKNKFEHWNFLTDFHKVFLFELKTRTVFELNVGA